MVPMGNEYFGSWYLVLWRRNKYNENAALIYQFVKRDVLARYRGSMLGIGWAVFNPLMMLALYTFAFAGVLKTRWPGAEEMGGPGYAINLFAGLIIFNLFSEVASRSSGLIVQNANLVKKVVFPLFIFSWVAVLSSMVQLFFGFLMLILAVSFYSGVFHISIITFPLIILAFVPFLLGLCWFFSSVGVYVRDLGQIMVLLINLSLFLSPIFYPASALPEYIGGLMWMNPLTLIIEQTRLALIDGAWPNWKLLLIYVTVSSGFALAGYAWFQRARKGFADVL